MDIGHLGPSWGYRTRYAGASFGGDAWHFRLGTFDSRTPHHACLPRPSKYREVHLDGLVP